jgi:hypothetical protein
MEKAPILSILPYMPISFVKREKTLNFFSMVITVGTPLSITAQELRMECMFPADEESEEHYLEMTAPKPKRSTARCPLLNSSAAATLTNGLAPPTEIRISRDASGMDCRECNPHAGPKLF